MVTVRFQAMKSFMSRVTPGAMVLAAMVACSGFSSEAQAGAVPDLFMSVEVSDGMSTLFDSGNVNVQSEGTDLGLLGYQYSPQNNLAFNSALFTMNGNVLARPNIGLLPATLHPNMTFDNNSDQTLEFLITYTLPMSTVAGVDWISNSAWTLAGGPDPAALTVNGESLWTVSMDGAEVGNQFAAPSGMGGGGTLDLSTDAIDGANGAIMDSVSIQLSFSITPGARIGANGYVSMTLIPAPAALALLGLGGLMAPRRRRH